MKWFEYRFTLQSGSLFFLLTFNLMSYAGLPLDFYTGVEFGDSMAYTNQNLQSTIQLQFENQLFNSIQSSSLYASTNRHSAIGSIFLGCGRSFKSFYLGAELTASEAKYDMNLSMTDGITRKIMPLYAVVSGTESMFTSSGVSPLQFGAFIRPGVKLAANALVYARIGATLANTSYLSHLHGERFVYVESNPSLLFPIDLIAVKKRYRAVAQIGPGAEYFLNKSWALRLDYLFSYYGKLGMSAQKQEQDLPLLITAYSHQSAAMYAQTIMLGLSYYV